MQIQEDQDGQRDVCRRRRRNRSSGREVEVEAPRHKFSGSSNMSRDRSCCREIMVSKRYTLDDKEVEEGDGEMQKGGRGWPVASSGLDYFYIYSFPRT